MSINLEHAIGCNVGFKNISHLHPNGRDYIKAVGGVVIHGDLNDPHEQTFLQGHDDFVTCLAVSHQGHLAASGQQGQNADVILWDLTTKSKLYCFQEQDHGIDCLCFSLDDNYLFSCGDIYDQRVFVYDTTSGLIIAYAGLNPKPTICAIGGGRVRDIKRRDTSEYMFAACGGKTIALWHMDVLKQELYPQQVQTAGKHIREFTCLAFSTDLEHLFAGTTSGDIAVILMKNRVVQTFVNVCSAGVFTLVNLPATEGYARIVAGGGDGTITAMSGPSPIDIREERRIEVDASVASLSLSSNAAELLAVTSRGTTVRVLTRDFKLAVHNQVCSGPLYDVTYVMGDSHHFLTCCHDGAVTMWDANDYSAQLRCQTRSQAHPVAAAASEDLLVAGCNDGRLMAFDCERGQNLWSIDNAHKGGVTSVKLSSNMRFVASAGQDGEVRCWEMKTREMMGQMKEHTARVNEVKLFPNDLFAISCSRDRCLLTWDLRNQKRLTAHRERHGGINCMALASNQTTVYTAGQEKTLTTWDLRKADPVSVLQVDEELHSISLSPDDRHLATAGTGLVVRIWDVTAGQEVSKGLGHSRAIQKVAFSPDGKQLVSVGVDHAALVWNLYT